MSVEATPALIGMEVSLWPVFGGGHRCWVCACPLLLLTMVPVGVGRPVDGHAAPTPRRLQHQTDGPFVWLWGCRDLIPRRVSGAG